jgi:hypothetical protein
LRKIHLSHAKFLTFGLFLLDLNLLVHFKPIFLYFEFGLDSCGQILNKPQQDFFSFSGANGNFQGLSLIRNYFCSCFFYHSKPE